MAANADDGRQMSTVGELPDYKRMPNGHTEHHYYSNSESPPGSKEGVPPTKPLTRVTSGLARQFGVRAALGLHATAPVSEEHDAHPHQQLWWSQMRLILREPFCEFWGVFVMIMFGNGGVAQVLLSQGLTSAPGLDGFGNYQSINWGWGIGVMLGIYVAGDSGAFLNPAITLAFSIFRGLPFRRFPMFLIAQFLGGFVASGVVYAVYIPSIDNFAGAGVRTVPPADGATAQIFCTYPASYLTTGQQFFDEFVGSFILIFVIMALRDQSNSGGVLSPQFFPLALLFLILGIGACFGYQTGYAINLARDLGPRLMSYAVGYGPEVWRAGDHYAWVPIVASFVGCFFGALVYDIFLYTGPESPVNTPYMGLPYLLRPDKFIRKRWAERSSELPEEYRAKTHVVFANVGRNTGQA